MVEGKINEVPKIASMGIPKELSIAINVVANCTFQMNQR